MNDILTNLLCFWPGFVSVPRYRAFHAAHHRWVGTPRDPELWLMRGGWRLPLRPWRVVLQFAGDLVGGALPLAVRAMILQGPRSLWEAAGPLLWWSIALSVLWATGAWWVLAAWLSAYLTTFWFSIRMLVWCEHVGLHAQSEGQSLETGAGGRPVGTSLALGNVPERPLAHCAKSDMGIPISVAHRAKSETGIPVSVAHRFRPNWWQKLLFFPHNIWLHPEHHRLPSIPLWRLPVVRVQYGRRPALPEMTLGQLLRRLAV